MLNGTTIAGAVEAATANAATTNTTPDTIKIFGFPLDPGTLLAAGMQALAVLAVLLVAWVVSVWVQRLVHRALERAKFDATLTKFFARVAKITILVLAVLACLNYFNFETTSFAAILAAAGFAIGLAFQGSLSNFSSGIMLLVFRPFRVGDAVNVAGQLGIVHEIELFTTTMDTFDNRRIIIPNGEIFGATIENITFHPKRRVDVPVGTAYDANLDKVRQVLEKAAESVPGRLEDEPTQVVLLELGASSIDWQVRVWAPTKDYFPVKEAAIRAVKMALDEAGISIPFPQMDIHYDKLPEGE
jgi:small conductance mechanosensitive channel